MTYYRGFAGTGSVLGADPPVSLLNTFVSNKILAVEAGEPVPWTKPEEPGFDENGPFGGPKRASFFVVLFADGHVQTLPQNFDPEMIRRMIDWRNTEPVNLP